MANNNDLFAPPTPDELQSVRVNQELAAPSEQELSGVGIKPNHPNMAALEGFGQGATFGLSDELAGATGGLADTLINDQDPSKNKLEQLVQNYKLYRDNARNYNKELQESNPKSFLAGEVAGGIASPVNELLPGAGLAKDASFATKLGKSMQAGTTAGALAGLGTSEGQTIGEDVANTAKGAGTGLVAGTALPIAAGLGKFARNSVTDTKLAKALGKAYKYGQSGEDVVSAQATRPLEQSISDTAKETSQDIINNAADLAKGQRNIINSDTKQYDLGNFTDQIDDQIAKLKNGPPGSEADIAKLEAMKDYINKSKPELPDSSRNILANSSEYKDYVGKSNPRMSLDKLNDLKKQFQGMAEVNPNYTDRMTTSEGEKAAKELKNSLYGAINDANEPLASQNKLISNFNNQLESAGLNNIDANRMEPGDLRKTQEYLTKLITSSEKEGITPQNMRERIEALKSAVVDTNPGLANKINDTFSDLSNKYQLNQYANKDAPLLGLNLMPVKQGTIRAAQETGKFMADLSSGLSSKTPEFFKSLGSTLASSADEGSQHLAPVIQKLADRDLSGRKALIFTIMQNPMYRKILGEHVNEINGMDDGQ